MLEFQHVNRSYHLNLLRKAAGAEDPEFVLYLSRWRWVATDELFTVSVGRTPLEAGLFLFCTP